ncbi:MAG: hypothetical protein ACRDGQ_13700, partial [Candidatus Limnocylindrales bacterium]
MRIDDWHDDAGSDIGDRLEDLIGLHGATNAEELWRALIAPPAALAGHPFEAIGLFRQHHGNGEPDALTTALLLCTDRRWEPYTGRLVAGLVDTGILDEANRGELVECFLWSDVYRVEYPIGWFGTRLVVVDPNPAAGSAPEIVEVDPVTLVPVERHIAPPLRRWAAAAALRRDPGTFAAVIRRARELDPRAGAAAMSGALDAVDALGQAGARRAIEFGLVWPRGSVRIQAIDLLADVDPEAARRR